MKRSLFALLAVLVAMSLIISACGATPEPTAAPQATTAPEATMAPEATTAPQVQPTEAPKAPALAGTITLWQSWKEEEIASLNKVIAAFQAKYPDVQFDVLYVPFDDLRGKYETAAATGGGPTVLIGAADWGPALYDAELVADVSGMASEEFLRTINAAALGAVKYKGALIGLPETIKGVVMFRNKTIIADAPASFNDLITAAKIATQGDVVGADLERGFFFSAAHLNGIGGQLMDDKGNPLFNDENGIAWLNLLNSFSDAGPTEYYTDNDVNLFKAGKAGIIIDGTWNMTALADAIGADNLSVDPWPGYMGGHLSGYVQTENVYLSANASGDDQQAGWAFMEYFLSPEAQGLLTEAGHIPAIAGVEVSDPLMQQAVTAFAGGAAFPVIPEMGAYWDSMDNALKSVFDEGADPTAALQQAYNGITAKVAELRGQAPPEVQVQGTITLWQSWKEEEIAGLNEVIAAFQAKHPDVQFDVLYVPFDDLRGKFETAAATGGGPTVLIGAADWGPALYDAELVADVTALSNTPFLASINAAALGAVKYKGALIGLPETIKGVVMFRNKTIIADAPATWDDLVAAAKAATQGDVVGADLERGFFFSAAHLNGIGGKLMETNGDPAFNNDQGVSWLNLLNSFSDAGPTEYYTDNDVNLFKAGKAGIIIDGTWNMAGLADAIGADNLVIDPWPTYGEAGHLSGYVQTENIYLAANASGDDQQAGWAFMEFFLSPEAQSILAKVGHIPAIGGVEVTDPLMQQAVTAFGAGAVFPVIPEMGSYWDSMDTALKSVFDEGADPATALQTAFDNITAKIAELRAGQ
jgi:maltose-binding protein MalE